MNRGKMQTSNMATESVLVGVFSHAHPGFHGFFMPLNISYYFTTCLSRARESRNVGTASVLCWVDVHSIMHKQAVQLQAIIIQSPAQAHSL